MHYGAGAQVPLSWSRHAACPAGFSHPLPTHLPSQPILATTLPAWCPCCHNPVLIYIPPPPPPHTQNPKFAMVVSGINRGDNMGLHVIYSGTVGAAREAACKVRLRCEPWPALFWLEELGAWGQGEQCSAASYSAWYLSAHILAKP